MQYLFNLFSFAGREFELFIVSMIPFIELRGSIILGAAMNMDWLSVFIISVIGNILPVPFIIIFGRKIISWLKTTKLFSKFTEKHEMRLMHKARKLAKYTVWGLLLFVAIPLPGTGAWSGSFIAALLDIRMKSAFPAISLGVIIAGIIMTIGSYGIFNIIQAL